MVTMKLRKPHTTASIWSSGKVTCTGATSDDDAKIASRKIARKLQQLGFRVRFCNYRVVNVLCTCVMYFGINLIKFAEKHRGKASYEPELHPGATYRINELKATLKIFTTGSITVTGARKYDQKSSGWPDSSTIWNSLQSGRFLRTVLGSWINLYSNEELVNVLGAVNCGWHASDVTRNRCVLHHTTFASVNRSRCESSSGHLKSLVHKTTACYLRDKIVRQDM
ncbi:TATA box-binding protein-like protein 1 [Trichonephila clavipes]|nr:TATA box-binding protein-like protein 1 [Trichonephila clavipes]